MNDREAMRRETRNLRREVHESQQFADKLQKEKRDLSNEMDLLIRSRSEFNNNSNNQERISNFVPFSGENSSKIFSNSFTGAIGGQQSSSRCKWEIDYFLWKT